MATTDDSVGPRLLDAATTAMAAEVGRIVADATGPLLSRAETAEAQVADLGAALSGANTELGRVQRELEAALASGQAKDVEIVDLKARIAELEAGQPPAKRTRLALAVGKQPPDTTQAATFTWLRDELRRHGIDPGYHTFSDNFLPERFAYRGDNGMLATFPDLPHYMTNVKTDLAAAADGRLDDAWRTFLTAHHVARPTVRKIFVNRHEPENDAGMNAALWRRGQVRFAEIFYDHPISETSEFAQNLMGWSAQKASGRNLADWDVFPELPERLRSRVIMAWNIYFRAEKSVDQNWAEYAKPAFDYSTARGQRIAVLETAVNNDAGRPSAEYAATVGGLAERYAASPAEAVCWYVHPGPAAGTRPWLDVAAVEALATALR